MLQQQIVSNLASEISLPDYTIKPWPLSQDELTASKKVILSKINILDLYHKYVKAVEPTYSTSFTHKSKCPRHKNGNERTPSFYFSQHDGSFKCFACSIFGDVFDLMSMSEGRPWQFIVSDLTKELSINLDNIEVNVTQGQDYTSFLFETNLKLSIILRNYMLSFKDKESFDKVKNWVESIYVKMDRRFSKVEDCDFASVKEFELQLLYELESHKLKNRV